MSEEQRRQERVSLEIAVNLETENNFFAGITDNISEGGVFVATVAPPPQGSVVELSLSLPGAPEPFQLKGIVRWIRDISHSNDESPPGCGVQFQNLPPKALDAINLFIKKRDTILFDIDDSVG